MTHPVSQNSYRQTKYQKLDLLALNMEVCIVQQATYFTVCGKNFIFQKDSFSFTL